MRYCLAVCLAMVGLAHAQAKDPWIGQRVFTRYGTVLKVENKVVDDEDRAADLKASGKARRTIRVYRVEHTNGEWLWLQAEKSGVSGWVQAGYVIPYEQATDHFTNEIMENTSSFIYFYRGAIWDEKGEYDIAIADYNEAIRLDPRDEAAFNNRGIAWSAKKDYGRAIADFGEVIRLDPKDADPYNARAWLWATCPDEKYRDGKKAVESATRACELSEWKEANHLGTLAASYAELGDFDQAVKREEAAMKLTAEPDGEEMKRRKERLALYRDRKPYREP